MASSVPPALGCEMGCNMFWEDAYDCAFTSPLINTSSVKEWKVEPRKYDKLEQVNRRRYKHGTSTSSTTVTFANGILLQVNRHKHYKSQNYRQHSIMNRGCSESTTGNDPKLTGGSTGQCVRDLP